MQRQPERLPAAHPPAPGVLRTDAVPRGTCAPTGLSQKAGMAASAWPTTPAGAAPPPGSSGEGSSVSRRSPVSGSQNRLLWLAAPPSRRPLLASGTWMSSSPTASSLSPRRPAPSDSPANSWEMARLWRRGSGRRPTPPGRRPPLCSCGSAPSGSFSSSSSPTEGRAAGGGAAVGAGLVAHGLRALMPPPLGLSRESGEEPPGRSVANPSESRSSVSWMERCAMSRGFILQWGRRTGRQCGSAGRAAPSCGCGAQGARRRADVPFSLPLAGWWPLGHTPLQARTCFWLNMQPATLCFADRLKARERLSGGRQRAAEEGSTFATARRSRLLGCN